MVLTVDIRGLDRVQRYFDRISKSVDGNIDVDSWNTTQMLAGELRKAKRSAGIQDFTGYLDRSLRAKKVRKHVYKVSMPAYALMLDRMRTHEVGPHSKPSHIGSGGGESIKAWMLARFGRVVNSITVKAHPFINFALLAVRQRLKGELINGKFIKSLRKS